MAIYNGPDMGEMIWLLIMDQTWVRFFSCIKWTRLGCDDMAIHKYQNREELQFVFVQILFSFLKFDFVSYFDFYFVFVF